MSQNQGKYIMNIAEKIDYIVKLAEQMNKEALDPTTAVNAFRKLKSLRRLTDTKKINFGKWFSKNRLAEKKFTEFAGMHKGIKARGGIASVMENVGVKPKHTAEQFRVMYTP